jgi:AraC-like DNA-binding protein
MMGAQALKKVDEEVEARMESRIFVAQVPSGQRVPLFAFPNMIVLSSATAPWRGFTVKRHLISPHETGWICIQQPLLLINIGAPAAIEWRESGCFHCERLWLNEIGLAPAGALLSHRWKGAADILLVSLDRVIEYINHHLGQDLTLTEMAAEVGMSLYYFAPLFKQSTGLTPHHYVMEQRVEWRSGCWRRPTSPLLRFAFWSGFKIRATLPKSFVAIPA